MVRRPPAPIARPMRISRSDLKWGSPVSQYANIHLNFWSDRLHQLGQRPFHDGRLGLRWRLPLFEPADLDRALDDEPTPLVSPRGERIERLGDRPAGGEFLGEHQSVLD